MPALRETSQIIPRRHGPLLPRLLREVEQTFASANVGHRTRQLRTLTVHSRPPRSPQPWRVRSRSFTALHRARAGGRAMQRILARPRAAPNIEIRAPARATQRACWSKIPASEDKRHADPFPCRKLEVGHVGKKASPASWTAQTQKKRLPRFQADEVHRRRKGRRSQGRKLLVALLHRLTARGPYDAGFEELLYRQRLSGCRCARVVVGRLELT
jgi:hypothetical protein